MKFSLYNHKVISNKRFLKWQRDFQFSTRLSSDSSENFVLLLPPPNITGNLHIGHSYENTIQDTLARFQRLMQKNVLFVPGFDHAGIAAQKKMSEAMKTAGIKVNKTNLSKFATTWHDRSVNNIKKQWANLGMSLNHDFLQYTLSHENEVLVKFIFKQLLEKKLIYRAAKIINHDVSLGTAISDLEVENRPINLPLYYIKYPLIGEQDCFVLVATVRPETIFADNCLLVNPSDIHRNDLIGKEVFNPLTNEKLKIYGSDIVDSEFGTGIAKCTPAHDPNDFLANSKLKLDYKSCININGKMINVIDHYVNTDRLLARKLVVKQLKEANLIHKIEDYQTSIKYSKRTNTIIEPLVTQQWFLKTKEIASSILKVCKNKDDKFYVNFQPQKFFLYYANWLKNMDDWCISRQILWGTKIPMAYNLQTDAYEYYDDKSKLASHLEPVSDVLDTWFNSSLWPFITLQYLSHREKVFDTFFPSSVLVSGYDIILFWVARMIMQSVVITNEVPFTTVLIHGLVRDKNNKKMSKMLNNGVDPNDLINQYGADALRLYLLSAGRLGDDIKYNEQKLKSATGFNIKLFNVYKLLNQLKSKLPHFSFSLNLDKVLDLQCQQIVDKTKQLINKVQEHFLKYQFNLGCFEMQNFLYNDFANKFLEVVKIIFYNANFSSLCKTYLNTALFVLNKFLYLYSCVAPFLSDFIIEQLALRPSFTNKNCLKVDYQTFAPNNFQLVDQFWNIINTIRSINGWLNLDFQNKLKIYFQPTKSSVNDLDMLPDASFLISKLAYCRFGFLMTQSISNDLIVYPTIFQGSIVIDTQILLQDKAILSYVTKQFVILKSELGRSKNVLNNVRFLQKASTEKINLEKTKLKNYQNQHDLYSQILNKR